MTLSPSFITFFFCSPILHPSPQSLPTLPDKRGCVVVFLLLGTAEHFTPEQHISHIHMRVLN